MGRRRFDYLVIELSVMLGVRVPRYELWLAAQEAGAAPEAWGRLEALHFCQGPLRRFLLERDMCLHRRDFLRLCRRVSRFDPTQPTPEERLGFESA